MLTVAFYDDHTILAGNPLACTNLIYQFLAIIPESSATIRFEYNGIHCKVYFKNSKNLGVFNGFINQYYHGHKICDMRNNPPEESCPEYYEFETQPDTTKYIRNLKVELKKRKISMLQMSRDIGVSTALIGLLANGLRISTNCTVAENIEKYLGLPWEYLKKWRLVENAES